MPSDLESSIRLLEETTNPADAYFSYTVDDSGEFGLIAANKEGLRLYAAEILKKSLEMEACDPGQPLFFEPRQWMHSDTGYDLIAGVLPHCAVQETAASADATVPAVVRHISTAPKRKSGLSFLLMCITGALLMLVSLKAFPNLRLWVNIH